MTAGELRAALEGVDDGMEVLIRIQDDETDTFFAFADEASAQEGHDDGLMFVIDGSLESEEEE